MTNNNSNLCTHSLKTLGDYWVLAIIDQLAGSPSRFKELEESIDKINTATLSSRLRSMQEAGLITRTERTRADVDYSLTELGEHAIPVVSAINNFSEQAKKQHTK